MLNNNANLRLETLSPDGKAPKFRLDDPREAQSLVALLVQSNRDRNLMDSRIKGQIDGNPPFSQSKLNQAAQGWRTNVNWLEAKAAVDAADTPYYDLFSSGKFYAELDLNVEDPNKKREWSQIASEEWDKMLKDYEGFDFNMQSMFSDRTCYGKGFLMWPDETNWQFEVIAQYRVLVPNTTKASLAKAEVVIVRQEYPVHILYGYIKNANAARSRGWDVEAVQEAIRGSVNASVQAQRDQDWMAIQQRLKDHDIYEGVSCEVVKAAHIFVKEFSGQISHLIVVEDFMSRNQQPSNGPEKDQQLRFLFKKHAQYEKFSEALFASFFRVQDQSWNGASGLGKDLYNPIEIKNRFLCATMDAGFIRAGISIQAKTPNALQKTAMIQTGSFNIIPDGYEVMQSTIMGDLQGSLLVGRLIDQTLAANTGIYKAKLDKPEGNPRTAREVEIDTQKQVTLSNSAVNRFYCDLNRLYKETYRRTLLSAKSGSGDEWAKMAKDFVDRCVKRGVDKKALEKPCNVMAFRVVGNGNAFMRQQATAQLMPFVPMLPEIGKQRFLEDVISSTTNQYMVDRYVPVEARENLPDQNAWEAMIENSCLKVGSPVVVTPEQNSVIHAQIHLQAAGQAAASLQQGANPAEVLAFLHMIGPHIAQHLQAFQNDPTRKEQFKVLSEQWKKLSVLADGLEKTIQSMQQKQQEQQQEQAMAQQKAQGILSGADPETQIAAAQAAQEMKIKEEKHQQAMMQREQKARQGIALKDATTAVNLRSKVTQMELEKAAKLQEIKMKNEQTAKAEADSE